MGPRWKGKGAQAKALADPMSNIVSQLQSSFLQSNTQGLLSGCSVLVEASIEQSTLVDRACFGRPINTADSKEKQWFQLGLEEAFYLCHSLKCLTMRSANDSSNKTAEEVWLYMKSMRPEFPCFYKAYSHLRTKNWVVRPGSQYGVDFVVYRHHPALVHSEYAVLVSWQGVDDNKKTNRNERLKVWSDLECTIRLSGSVAKTLLVLDVSTRNGYCDLVPCCLKSALLKNGQLLDGILIYPGRIRKLMKMVISQHALRDHSSTNLFSTNRKLVDD